MHTKKYIFVTICLGFLSPTTLRPEHSRSNTAPTPIGALIIKALKHVGTDGSKTVPKALILRPSPLFAQPTAQTMRFAPAENQFPLVAPASTSAHRNNPTDLRALALVRQTRVALSQINTPNGLSIKRSALTPGSVVGLIAILLAPQIYSHK